MQVRVRVDEASGVAEARRVAEKFMRPGGFGPSRQGAVALAVTELATNLLKHATRGVLVFRAVEERGATGLELLCIDNGPGIANIAQSRRDGHSTAGSLGLGLGTIERIASGLDIYSAGGKGTLLRCMIWAADPVRPTEDIEVGAICLPVDGETECGDAWVLIRGASRHVLVLMDGLGHGPEAARAAATALRAVERAPEGTADSLLDMIHDALRPTRGAAGAVAIMKPQAETVSYCGIGNTVALTRAAGKSRHLISHNGTLGHQARKMTAFDAPFPAGSLLIMHTDGINTHWNLDDYSGLDSRHPALVAAILYRDHDRGRDDRAIVVVRNGTIQ